MRATLMGLSNFIQTASNNPDPFYPLPPCADFHVTPTALQFTCGGMDVDVMLAFDWDSEEGGGYVTLYEYTCRRTLARARQW